MKNPYEEYKDSLNTRKARILDVAASFINKGASIIMLNPKSKILHMPATDRIEAVKKALDGNAYLNIGVEISNANSLIAIEQESIGDPAGDNLSDLVTMYGVLSSTMTIVYPDNKSYRLYERPASPILRSTLAEGVKVIKETQYGAPQLVLLSPSELEDGSVLEISHSDRIAVLPSAWVDFICSDPYAEFDSDNTQHPCVTEKVAPNQQLETIMHNEPENDEQPHHAVILKEYEWKESGDGSYVKPQEFIIYIIGKMAHEGKHPAETMKAVWEISNKYNIEINEKELYDYMLNAYSAQGRYEGVDSISEMLLRFVADVEIESFTDHHKELCCKIRPTGEIILLSSKSGSRVANYLAYRMFQLTNKMPKNNEISNVVKIIELTAQFEGEEVKMFNRVGEYDGAIYYDLGSNDAVRVTEAGWAIEPVPPIFRRYANFKEHVRPQTGGKINRLFEFINHDPKDRLLLSVYTITSFVPEIAHPLLYVYGSHGGAKSSTASKIKTVIDPGVLDRLIMNDKKEEVIRNLKQHYVSHYDNVSFLHGDTSDVFCIASTGGGMDNRKKYTDEESHIMSFKHCVILNGIKLAIKKPDLLDRSILVKLKRVKAKDERLINERFEAALPEILGGVFDALSTAMALLPSIEVESFRMASFARWGYAVAEALGGYGEQFLEDYRANIAEQNDMVAQTNSLIHAVLAMMENKREALFTIGKAFDELKRHVRTTKNDRTFPTRDKDLRPYLEELGPVLDSYGIRFEFGKVRTNVGWTVTFYNDKAGEEEQPV